jgi:signal transduction histidine kinase
LNGLVRTLNERIERNPDGSSIYLIASPTYAPLAGNLSTWPEGAPTEDGWLSFPIDDLRDDGLTIDARARLFVLQGGFRLLVGRDIRALENTQQLIVRALLWGLAITVALGLVGGLMMSRGVLRRIEQINQTSREIMAGDLSRRIPTRGNSDDFDQLAEHLNAMLDEIERLMEGIRRVSDNIAHDLRTPLTRLRNRLESLRGDLTGDVSQRERVDTCIADADQLLVTFRALLRIAHIEAGTQRAPADPVDLATLTQDAADFYEALAEDKRVALNTRITGAPTVAGDRDLIFQAITNLLDNALKYTPTDGQVTLSVSETAHRVDITVADTGPGIPEAERHNVTQRFHRLESSRSTPGTGLGLSLVAAVARFHQATLLLEDNAPGLRATLRFGS